NEDWAGSIAAEQPAYFETLAKGQSPRVLWFGCADSRTTPATILGNVELGEVFVHRNIANVLPVTDLSSLSVLTYAVGHLGVEHVVVCGHSQCGGVKGAISGGALGILDHWLAPVKALIEQNKAALDAAGSAAAKEALVTKLNIEAG
ncbi:carbonic anhydrase, partial [Ramicandelaber brevisporus]